MADYLTALRAYTVQTLERRLGREVMGRTKVEYVLTVPAVWSDKARQMTMEAAMRAGLGLGGGAAAEGEEQEEEGTGLLRLITEPEGAAEYALRSIQPNSMKVGYFFNFYIRFLQKGIPARVRVGYGGVSDIEIWNTLDWDNLRANICGNTGGSADSMAGRSIPGIRPY